LLLDKYQFQVENLNMKTVFVWIILVASLSYQIPVVANTSIIKNNQPTNECGMNNIEVIVGGKVEIKKIEAEQNSKCFIYAINDSVKTERAQLTKRYRPISAPASQRNNFAKINFNDPSVVKDRDLILQSELRKAVLLKDELEMKKKNGILVDDLQLTRLIADIAAIKNEISR
jgi:hypothetical protein